MHGKSWCHLGGQIRLGSMISLESLKRDLYSTATRELKKTLLSNINAIRKGNIVGLIDHPGQQNKVGLLAVCRVEYYLLTTLLPTYTVLSKVAFSQLETDCLIAFRSITKYLLSLNTVHNSYYYSL